MVPEKWKGLILFRRYLAGEFSAPNYPKWMDDIGDIYKITQNEPIIGDIKNYPKWIIGDIKNYPKWTCDIKK